MYEEGSNQMSNLHIDIYAGLLDRLLQKAAAARVYLIARLQRAEVRSVTVTNGKTESISTGLGQGLGLQVFTESGHTAFAATDILTEGAALTALETAVKSARAAAGAGLEANRAVFNVSPISARVIPPTRYAIDELSLAELQQQVETINRDVLALNSELKARTSCTIEREEWHIVRSDGASVAYLLPRCYCYNVVTARRDEQVHTVSSSLSGSSYEVVLDAERRAVLLGRARRAADLAVALLDAPDYPAGSYDLVLDYALAKGLAHEAFGHAAEADGLRSSILGDDQGRFRTGAVVAAPIVSIIDESIEGDHAYQPFSPNGVPRTRTTIIDHGVLREALADVFSADAAGVRVIDAARAQSYARPAVPRMTNIRIEVDDPLPLPRAVPFEEQTPEDVRQALLTAGLLREGRPVIYLSGYKGGQVNPARGDFVFNCAALYELTTEGVRLFQPAIFSGRTLAALKAIKAGFGPLQLDSMGFCGKMGQSVPSSGGSHFFLFLEANPQVVIGGR